MLCKTPFCRKPTGEIKALAKVNPDVRLAVTPFPCGQCLHCRINLSQIWSTRIKMERNLWPDSLFITLTYNDEHLPIERGTPTLNPDHYTKFLKKFRNYVYPRKIRTFGVGEYGKITSRPHLHIIIFNSKIGDEHLVKQAWLDNKGKEIGFIDCDYLTDGLSDYISGYVVDKLIERGQIDVRVYPPFMRASRGNTKSICAKFKGGIGAGYAYYVSYQILQNKYVTPEDITNMVYGKSMKPIGRYLTNIISYETGIDDDVFRIKAEEYYDTLLDAIYEQVQLDVKNPSKNPYKEKQKALTYWDSIRARTKQKRLAQKKRQDIYRRRTKI